MTQRTWDRTRIKSRQLLFRIGRIRQCAAARRRCNNSKNVSKAHASKRAAQIDCVDGTTVHAEAARLVVRRTVGGETRRQRLRRRDGRGFGNGQEDGPNQKVVGPR